MFMSETMKLPIQSQLNKYKVQKTKVLKYQPYTHPSLIKRVVEIRLNCNGTVGVCVRKRLPEKRLPF